MFKENESVKWLWIYDAVIVTAQYDKYKERQMYLIRTKKDGHLHMAFKEDLKSLD